MPENKVSYNTDKTAKAFLLLAISYLLFALLMGVTGGFQYILPDFLKDKLSFQQTRPLHVYLAISWIFTAAQGSIYYYLPRIANRPIAWKQGVRVHLLLQISISITIIICFFLGYFGGREYLEFPPFMGLFIFASWIPFTINFFRTLKPNYKTAPVYIWNWTTGIIFFFITLSESYLWLIDYFGGNIIRDVTVQWKALGSMVGSWNMLVYGISFYVMEKVSGNTKIAKSPIAFFFYFLGFTNLMFNWGHHTYIVPAAPWVKMVAYIVTMTELLILGNIIWQWRKTLSAALKNYSNIPYRFMMYAEVWIFLNLILALIMSVPAWNYYTHGTHITVAHAMGTTIGINTMLLFASIFFIIQEELASAFGKIKKWITAGGRITNTALIVFWASLLGSGIAKISAKMEHNSFTEIMKKCAPWFQAFTYSGIIVYIGILILSIAGVKTLRANSIKRTDNS